MEPLQLQNDILKRLRDLYGQPPFKRSDREYGFSGVGFCKQKPVLERTLHIEPCPNGDMVRGKLWHGNLPMYYVEMEQQLKIQMDQINQRIKNKPKWYQFRALITYYQFLKTVPQTIKMINAKMPQFEVETKWTHEHGWSFVGHCDVDDAYNDKIVELKTTDNTFEWDDLNPIYKAYVKQANGYGYVRGRKYWELWKIRTEFDNLNKEDVVLVKRGEVSKAMFDETAENTDFIDQAINADFKVKLAGPEHEWECKHCNPLIFYCPHRKAELILLKATLPIDAKSLPEKLKYIFECAKNRKVIAYNRSFRIWEWVGIENVIN